MAIISGVGSSGTVSSASGGKVYAFNNINETTNVLVAPANPARQVIEFHNPGPNDMYISPVFQQTTGGNTTLVPSNAALGGARLIYGNGGTLRISGECQGAWQALSKTGAGSTNPLTVMDSNIA